MRAYLLVAYLSFFSELLPLAGALYRRTSNQTRWKVVLFASTACLFDLSSRAFTLVTHGNNIWFEYLSEPILATLAFWFLYDWQRGRGGRVAVRVLLAITLVLLTSLYLGFESPTDFSLVTATVTYLTVLCLALYTLVSRSLTEHRRLLDCDWFWALSGLVLYCSLQIGGGPAQRYVQAHGTVEQVFQLVMGMLIVVIVAMITITRGMLCPEPETQQARFPGLAVR